MTENEITPEMQAKKAIQIGKLIAMSEDDSQPAATRAAYAEKAEQIMREYRIDEERVISTEGSSITPIRFEIVLVQGLGRWYAGEFQDAYQQIWREIKKHAGLKSHNEYRYDGTEDARRLVAVGYGYQMDIRLAQFLWTAAHLTFATRIDTKVDRNLSDQLNCYFMRGSGMERNDIAEQLWGSARTDGPAHGKVQKLYLAECAERGETPTVGGKGFQGKRYRESYAKGFVDQFGYRLRDARDAIDAQSGALVLAGRSERIAEAYYAEWPNKAPLTPEQQAVREEASARYWARVLAEQLECLEKGNCRAAVARAVQRADEQNRELSQAELDRARCRKHREYEPTAADRQRWAREDNAPERSAGRRAGVAAASSVDFRRTAGDRKHKAEAAPERVALGN